VFENKYCTISSVADFLRVSCIAKIEDPKCSDAPMCKISFSLLETEDT
jgi:hypothetical protein